MIAHIAGLPVEEVLPVVMGGGGAWFVVRLTLLAARLRARRADPG